MAGLGGHATIPGHEYLGGLSHLGSDDNFYYSGMEGLIFLLYLAREKKQANQQSSWCHRVETGADMTFLKGIRGLIEISVLESLSN